MNDPEYSPLILGRPDPHPGPLARFLPPHPAGIAAQWLARQIPPGSWVLDPFGSSPALTVEIARAGYRVLVVANNPILHFLITARAASPSQADLQSALAEIATARKGDERLEPLIKNLYQTHCAACGKQISATSFVWQKDNPHPIARVYDCPYCHSTGEHPADPEDEAVLNTLTGSGLHRARALERVAALGDPHRADVEEALNGYLARPLYVLFNLINKMEGLDLTPDRRRWVTALILSALDAGNTLWAHPNPRPRPRQLTIPSTFRENNLWLALESAVEDWNFDEVPVPLASFPNSIPSDGGILLAEGRLKDLLPQLSTEPFGAVLAALPRPNQAFWTLSALWTGWLWGRDAVAPLKSVLSRRRYDWAWHTTALHSVFNALGERLVQNTPVLGLLAEAEPSFMGAVLLAAENANLRLKDIALDEDAECAQIQWQIHPPRQAAGLPSHALIKSTGLSILKDRGEPTATLNWTAGILTRLVNRGAMRIDSLLPLSDAYTQIQTLLRASLAPAPQGAFIHYGGEHTLEGGQWWHPQASSPNMLPLSDQVEMEVVRALQTHPDLSLEALLQILYPRFPGLLTPSTKLVSACLDSYGERSFPPQMTTWRLRPQDTPALRRADLEDVSAFAGQIATHLGYRPSGNKPMLWLDQDGSPHFALWMIASAIISPALLSTPEETIQPLLVLPSERLNLAAYKLANDPRLAALVHGHWRILPFDLLQRTAADPDLTRPTWQAMLAASNTDASAVQMGFFS